MGIKDANIIVHLHDAQSFSVFFFNSKAKPPLTSLRAQCGVPQITWESATDLRVVDIKTQRLHKEKT